MTRQGNPDPRAMLDQLGAVRSPDFNDYASGRIPVERIRCLICESSPCDCQARGLVFGSAAYFARLDAIHGRTRSAPARTCSARECPVTAHVGEHPAGIAISGSGNADGGRYSHACIAEVTQRHTPSPGAGTRNSLP